MENKHEFVLTPEQIDFLLWCIDEAGKSPQTVNHAQYMSEHQSAVKKLLGEAQKRDGK